MTDALKSPRLIHRADSLRKLAMEQAQDDVGSEVAERRVLWRSEAGSELTRVIYSDGTTLVIDGNGMTYETDRTGTYKSWYGPFEHSHVPVDKRASLRIQPLKKTP